MTYSPSVLQNIDIVLVRPENQGNIGSVARIIRNFGFGRLRIVTPRNPLPREHYLNDEARRLAHRSEDILDQSFYFHTLRDALEDRTWAIAASGRNSRNRVNPPTIRSIAADLCLEACDNPGAIVFGSESDGLDERDIALCNFVVRIPQYWSGPSLNLAQAAAIVCSELFQATLIPGTSPSEEYAPRSSVSRVIQRTARLARHCGLTIRNRPEELSDALSTTMHNCRYSLHDIAVFEQILSQVEWFTGLNTHPEGG